MEINRKYALNKKKLTKKEVQDILATNPPFDSELSKPFEWTWADGYTQKNKLYKLPDDQYLFVFDPKDISSPNRGDIFSKNIVEKWVAKMKRSIEDVENNRYSSSEYWRYFSKAKVSLINLSEELRQDLATQLNIPAKSLDYSYKSLDLISEKLRNFKVEFIRENYIDNLVSYIGEVIIRRVDGHWAVEEKNEIFDEMPYVGIDLPKVHYMPINVIYTCLISIEDIYLRKETANEVRAQSSQVSFQRILLEKKISSS